MATPAKKANVAFIRKEVRDQFNKWGMIRDCLAGQEAIKGAGTKYLPMPNPEDQSKENKDRYESYKERAVFYNVTRRTLDGLVGQVFMREPVLDLKNAKLQPLVLDVDGAGVSLAEQGKKTLADTMSYGRVGLLTDYPETDGSVSLADQEKGFIRPTILLYQPDQIINWRTVVVGARKLLSLVVLKESYTVEDDGFEPVEGTQWRVLKLIEGVYTVEIWREQPKPVDSVGGTTQVIGTGPVYDIADTFVPVDASGNPFDEIPFTIIGSVNNDPDVDEAPLYNLAVLNIGHYRNSADYEESCFLVGQPTLFAAGLTEHWVTSVLKGEVRMGSRAALPLPEGGTAGLLQVNPNSMPKEAMETKERQMVALGARLVEQRNVQRTLGEAQIEESGETSILATVSKNITAAYNRHLKFASAFVGGADTSTFTLNTDFIAAAMTPEERAQLVSEWQSAAISYTEMRNALRKAGVASLEDEKAKSESEEDTLRMGPKTLMNPGNSLTGGANNGRTSPRQNGKTQ